MKDKESMLCFPSSKGPSSSGNDLAVIQRFREATERFTQQLKQIDERCRDPRETSGQIQQAVVQAFNEMTAHFDAAERGVGNDPQRIRELQVEFRQNTAEWFFKSRLMHHARTWPHGYTGDYEMLETVYRNESLSTGLGYYLDRHFLSKILARAVRDRKEFMRSLLEKEISARKDLKILNLASGSGREVEELADMIKASGAVVTCVDFDPDALRFSEGLFDAAGLLPRNAILRKYNVQKMVSRERNEKEFGPQDVIYSIGLFDYLGDDLLVRLLGALFDLLAPGGKLIASFKDCTRYDRRDYQWMVDWGTFLQRTEQDCRSLVDRAEVPRAACAMHRDASGVIMFFVISR